MSLTYTSHWRSPLLADVDATIVSISRGQPRWSLPFRYRMLKELAPDNETWAQEDREAFEESYIRQLDALGIERVLGDIEQVSGGKPAVLLCWEKPTDLWCHRWLLSGWIQRETGVVIPELEPGMLETKPDAPQPSLFEEQQLPERST